MENKKILGKMSANTGQIVIMDPYTIYNIWNEAKSSKGVQFWGDGADEIATVLIEQDLHHIEKINNWYRVRSGFEEVPSLSEIQKISKKVGKEIVCSELKGDTMFDLFYEINKTKNRSGEFEKINAVTFYSGKGYYEIEATYEVEEEELQIKKLEVVLNKKEANKEELIGKVKTNSGGLLFFDPANIRLDDWEMATPLDYEEGIYSLFDDYFNMPEKGGQIVYDALKVHEYFVIAKVKKGEYQIKTQFHESKEGVKTHHKIIIEKIKNEL